MSGKLYTLITFVTLFWFFCLYTGFRNEKKIITPVEFFLFSRQLPSWAYFALITSVIFSGLIFFFQPSLIFLNGLPFSVTSLFVITIPLVGVIFSKRQWLLSKKYGYLTPAEMVSDYFRSDILRILIVLIALGFSIPFIAMQLSFGGLLLNILSDDILGIGSASILIGAVVCVYLSTGGIRSLIIIDSIQFLLIIFGIFCIGFIAYDLVGGWGLLNESLSRVANIKENLFNIKESYSSYLSIPGTIETVNLLNDELPYNGIWTSSMILTFVLALSGVQLAPNVSMITYASKDPGYFATQQIWFSAFLIGFLLIFFVNGIGLGSSLLGANNVINESGNNVSNILPPNIYPDNFMSLVPNIINLVGEYSFIFFGILGLCAIAAIQSMASLILTSSAIVTRDVVKRFFVKNLTNRMEIFSSRILIMFIFIISLILSLLAQGNIFDLASFSLAIACQMFVPLAAICYFSWFTKQGIAFGIVIGIAAIIFTDGIGQNLFGEIIPWSKWPLTIHSSAWGLFFNIIGAIVISFITQEIKETKIKKRIHEFIDEHKNYSLTRRSLKPSAWIILVVWLFFAFGPGLMIGNELFGNPINVESWSFGMPSVWVWQIIFWGIGILLVWFLAVKMEMSTSFEKNIVSQTEDINNT